MNIDTRAVDAAEAVRRSVVVDSEAGLAALVATHRRRRAGSAAVAAGLVALTVVAGQALLGGQGSQPPEPAEGRSSGIVFDLSPEDKGPGLLGVVRHGEVQELATTLELPDPVAMDLARDGRRLALVDGESRLHVVDTNSSEEWSVPCRACVEVTWAGRHVLTRGVDDGGATVTWMHRPFEDSPPQEVRLPAGAPLSGISPNGDEVVTVQQVGEVQNLALTDRVSGETVPLPTTTTEPGENITEVRWSPTGHLGYVVSRVGLRDPAAREYRLDTVLSDGSWDSVLADLGTCACGPTQQPSFSWSPDGLEVAAVVASRDGGSDRFRVVTLTVVEVGNPGPEEKQQAMREVAPSGGAPVVWGGPAD
jgi:hypothetical protein